MNRICILGAFAIAMGHLEAVVVVYIRQILGAVPTPEVLDPKVLESLPEWLLDVERTREAATIIMLVCLALLVARVLRERVAYFLIAFGVWDIAYYISLKGLIDWPSSPGTLDCLFLIPKPWYVPVWVPVVISCGMVAAGLALLRRARSAEGPPALPGRR